MSIDNSTGRLRKEIMKKYIMWNRTRAHAFYCEIENEELVFAQTIVNATEKKIQFLSHKLGAEIRDATPKQ